MKAHAPALGISERYVAGDVKVYEIQCECSATGHDVTAWIEVEPDADLVMLTFYVEPYTLYDLSWKSRIKMVWDIITKGQYKLQHELILTGQAALNVSVALEKAIKELDLPRKTKVF